MTRTWGTRVDELAVVSASVDLGLMEATVLQARAAGADRWPIQHSSCMLICGLIDPELRAKLLWDYLVDQVTIVPMLGSSWRLSWFCITDDLEER